MKVGVLGPLEVTGPSGRADVTGAKERLVLAMLALHAGQVVSRDALIDASWGGTPPPTAVKTMQGHVARARRALEAVGLAGVLATREPGYLLSVPAESVDATDFERGVAAGRGSIAAGDARRGSSELGAALALWRGDALADCRAGGWAAAEAVRLDEERRSALEDRVAADLLLGRHLSLVGELEALVARHPLRERSWAALMEALYRSGRTGDALRAYQRARDVLVGELGLEPGVALRALEATVLAGHPMPEVPQRAAPKGPAHRSGATLLDVPIPSRVRAASSPTFVGRDTELTALRRSWSVVRKGGRHVVLLSGEPGIGKTALSASFACEAFSGGAVIAYGRCDDDLGIPYQPWAEALGQLAGHLPEEVLADHLAARGEALARWVPDLAVRPPDSAPTGEGDAERYLLFGAVVDLLARVSAFAPVLLILDDIHWADRTTIQLLRHVVSADVPVRLLLIGTFRESEVDGDRPIAAALAALRREPDVARVALQGLGDDEVLSLVETTAVHVPARDRVALRDALQAEADGNPFFLGELLRHRAESPRAADRPGSRLPMSIREVIVERVDRLGATARAALSAAAVIGRDFDTDVLALVADIDGNELLDVCDRAVAATLLAEGDGPGGYTFVHALIEHALYEELSAGRRGVIHRRVAEALEAVCGELPSERSGELASHWAQAQPPNPVKAIVAAQQAGDWALTQLAPDEALRWYRDAASRLEESGIEDLRRRAELLLGLGAAQRQTADPAHRETLLAAGTLADDIGAVDILVSAALQNNRGWNSIIGAVDAERVDMLTLALSRLRRADDPRRARLLSLRTVEVTWDTGFDERLAMATEAVDLARRVGDPGALVDAIRLCQVAITMPHTLELRRQWNAEACALAEDLGDPNARLHANDYRYLAALEAGDLPTMRIALEIFVAESERIGQPSNRWQLAFHSALQQMVEGDLAHVEETAAEAMALGVAAGHAEDATRLYGSQLVGLRWMQGRSQEGIAQTEEMTHALPQLRVFRASLACAWVANDQQSDARRLLDTEVADDFPLFADTTWLTANLAWAEAAARTGHRPAALVLYRRLRPWSDQFATTHVTVRGSVAHYLGLLAHTLGRHDRAATWFRVARDRHEAMEAPFFVALTQVASSALLADDAVGDVAAAKAQAHSAKTVAAERGYGGIERDADALLEGIGTR